MKNRIRIGTTVPPLWLCRRRSDPGCSYLPILLYILRKDRKQDLAGNDYGKGIEKKVKLGTDCSFNSEKIGGE